ncbi:MAG: ABC transporter permease [Bryobacteraceae bacterium]|jgi:putative ABC transport system permease protein
MLFADLHYAVRILRKTPVFTLAAVATLALGVGANAAIFSVINAVLLQPLGYPQPGQLVTVWENDIRKPDESNIVSAPNFLDWQRQNDVFERMAIYEHQIYNLAGQNEPEQVSGMRVSSSIFPLLGIQPYLGRTFLPEEDRLGKDRLVVLSYGLWRRRYGADPNLLGKPIKINGDSYTVVGVMPSRFQFPDNRNELWVPIALNAQDQGRASHSFMVVARLKPGVTMAQVKTEMDAIGRRLSLQYPNENASRGAMIIPTSDWRVKEVRPILFALLGAVGFVLLIACSNVANLLLARAAGRRKEFALRTALGASRFRVIRQLLIESAVLALAGGAVGVLFAIWGISLLVRILPSFIKFVPFRQLDQLSVDSGVLLFALFVSLATGLLFGLAPALQASRTDLNESLKEGGGRVSTGHRANRLRALLVVSEVALALVVLTGAGLMIETIVRLSGVAPGFDPNNLLTMQIALPQTDTYGAPERTRFCEDVGERVGAVAGVQSVSAVSHLPLSGAGAGRSFVIQSRPDPNPSEEPNANYSLICPNYFQTMGIPLLKGREFSSRDTVSAPQVVIVNDSLARRYWPKEDPIGRTFKLGGPRATSPWLTIVGVVRDVHHWSLDYPTVPQIFRPYSQAAWPVMTLVARTAGDPAVLATAIRKAAADIDREQPVSNVATMEQVIHDSLGFRRFPMLLLGTFAFVALALAAVGIYGVMSYSVAQRTREIGIRMALGAGRGEVLRLILGRSLVPVAAGVAIGVAAALALTRVLTSLLFEVSPSDPLVFTAVTLLLMSVAVIASLAPAFTAASVNPVIALRHE